MLRKVDTTRFDVDGAGDPGGSVFGLPHDEEVCSAVLVPVPWEPTTSYGRGASGGPAAIRAASPQLDLFDAELDAYGIGDPWMYGIHMRREDPEVRAWNDEACRLAAPIIAAGGANTSQARAALARVDALSHQLDVWVHGQAAALLERDKLVGIVGGDHSVSFGAIAAHVDRHRGLGVLHIDAHADLRERYEGFARSHASIMHNVIEELDGVGRLVQVGVRDQSRTEHTYATEHSKIRQYPDHLLRRRMADGEGWTRLCDEIMDDLPARVWVSFDIDGLDPALCPSTGTPVPGGLAFHEAMMLCSALLRRGKQVVGFDLVEVAPSAREGEQWDGNVGARVLYRLCGVLLGSHLS